MLTRLIAGEGGESLSAPELLHNCIFLLNAGHETTTNLIGNALHALTQWPDQRARLLDDPASIETAVEEFLRFDSSNQLGNRISTQPACVGDVDACRIARNAFAAQRTATRAVRRSRPLTSRSPNRHLAFGFGIHTCAVSISRAEGRVAIGRFLARFPAYAPTAHPLVAVARFRGFCPPSS